MKPTLFAVTGKNGFCDPTAIVTVMGIDTDHAAAIVRSISGQVAVKAMSTASMFLALRKLGCEVRLAYPPAGQCCTVAQWFKANTSVFFRQHVIMVADRRYLCSLTGRQTVTLNDLPKPRARVENIIVVSKLPTVALQAPAGLVNAINLTEAAAKRRASALAGKWTISLEREFEDGSIWVSPSGDTQDNDPFDSHFCDDWNQALQRVRAYVDLLKIPSPSMACSPAQT